MPSELQKKLDDELAELIRHFRPIDPESTDRLERVIAAREAYLSPSKRPVESKPYALTQSGIEAVCDWLKKAGGPRSQGEIIKGVLDGGFQEESPRRELNVKNSVEYHVKNPKTKRLRKVGRLIEVVPE